MYLKKILYMRIILCLNGRNVLVYENERRCINCTYFRQYYTRNAGSLYSWINKPIGECLLTGKDDKRASCGACKEFDKKGHKKDEQFTSNQA